MEQKTGNFKENLKIGSNSYFFYDLNKLEQKRVLRLPFTIRILLESTLRKQDGFVVKPEHIENILNWGNSPTKTEIPFYPSRVLL